jgi:glycosyltransferase involved in cell wall biosynthesis
LNIVTYMHANTPLVSVCIAAYNVEKYIDETIQSVLNQTYPHIELIIVNDGSTDGTAATLRKYEGEPMIRIVNSPNRGPCGASNLAFHHSQGEYIKFFDADDILNENHIEAQVNRLLDNPDCLAAGQVKRFYNNDLSTALHEPLATWQDLEPVDWLVIDDGKGMGMMPAWLFLIPRPLLERAGGWNEELSLICDFEFSPRVILQAGKVLFVEEAKIFYRSGLPNSVSNSLGRKPLLSAFTALSSTESMLLGHEDSDRVRRALSQMWHLWIPSFYLDEMDLYRKAKEHLRGLGHYPDNYFKRNGSKWMRLLGWKNQKRIKRIVKKLTLFTGR